MADRRNGDSLRYRYGKCLNDNCEKGKSKEVIEVPARKDFVCPECGRKLDECAPPKKKNMVPVYAGIGIVVLGIIIALILIFKPKGDTDKVDDSNPAAGVEQTIDSLKNDTSIPAVEPAAEGTGDPKEEEEVKDKDKDKGISAGKEQTGKTASNYLSSYSLPYGRYTGPAKNGVPEGLEGEVVVTQSYSLDMHNGSSLQLENGDKITRCKFKNGKLVSGMLNRPDGTSRTFNIGVN